MKAWFAYEDGACFALRTDGAACYTARGSRYDDFSPEMMLKAGAADADNYLLPPKAQKILCVDEAEAESAAAGLIAEWGGNALTEDGEFWRVTVEMNPLLLFFAPDEYRSKELYRLAVIREGRSLRYVPPEDRAAALCEQAVYNCALALEFVPAALKTVELCQKAVKESGGVLAFVPDPIKSGAPEGYALCLEAVKNDGLALRHVPEQHKTGELCLEAVKQSGRALKFVPENLKTPELCLRAVSPSASWKSAAPPPPEAGRWNWPCVTRAAVSGTSPLFAGKPSE